MINKLTNVAARAKRNVILSVLCFACGCQTNTPPTWISPATITVSNQTEKILYIAEAIDPDGDTVTYQLSSKDTKFFSLDKLTGELIVTKTLLLAGKYEITLTALDGNKANSQQRVTIKVIKTKQVQ